MPHKDLPAFVERLRGILGAAAKALAFTILTAARSGEALKASCAITVEAFDAIAGTLPLGSVGYKAEANERGERLIWLDRAVVDRLRSLRGPRESYGDVILRLAAESG
jgi:hypothetical protein